MVAMPASVVCAGATVTRLVVSSTPVTVTVAPTTTALV
jgi:hypothetical protein